MRILLVEDEAPLRETLAARLKREGFAVDAAQDGEEGLYMGREVPFDVAIIDLGLPKMSGMELVKALRDEGKNFPVLILTARSSWQDKVEHALLFAGLAILGIAAWPHRAGLLAAGLLAYGAAMEVAQSTTAYRVGDPLDWLADAVGLLVLLPFVLGRKTGAG